MNNLIDKIKKIEALIAGAATEGEAQTALAAKRRVQERIAQQQVKEYTLYTPDTWHKKLLMALCRKYGIAPYRYHRQKYTTVMVQINETFLNEVLWEEYLEYAELLEKLVTEITDDLIKKIHEPEEEVILTKKLLR
ncbi:MAG: hypothetical protein AAF960_20390 [Bacteroidota bacterium]